MSKKANVEIEMGFNYYLKQKWKLNVTLFCLFSFITMGIHLEISGSTMLPLSRQLGTNLGELAWIVAAKNFGYMISIILFGIILQSITKNHCEFLLSIGYLFPAAATASTPYLTSLWSLCIALLFQGMLQGLSDIGVNTLVTTIWEDHSTGPLNCVYLGYTIGGIFSIFLVQIFRVNNSLIDKNINSKQGEFQSELVGPYLIASIFCLISSIGFGFIGYKQYKIKKQEQQQTKKVCNYQVVSKKETNSKNFFWINCSPTTCGQGYFMYGFILMSLLLLFYFLLGGIEQSFTKFFISFLEQEKLNLNKKYLIYSMIFYWLSMFIGRIISTFVTTLWINADLMLTISFVLSLLIYFVWIIFLWYIGLTSLSLFILLTLNGLSVSPIYPTLIGWMKQFLSLTPIELALFFISNAIGGIVFSLISGYVFQYINSKHLFTILTIGALLCFILFLLIFIIQYFHSIKQQQQQQQQDEICIED